MHGEGFGVRTPKPTDAFWIAATGMARGSLRLTTALRLTAEIGIAVPFRRDEFVLDQLDNVHQAGSVVGRALIGPEGRF
jgi:hypothetical protein